MWALSSRCIPIDIQWNQLSVGLEGTLVKSVKLVGFALFLEKELSFIRRFDDSIEVVLRKLWDIDKVRTIIKNIQKFR